MPDYTSDRIKAVDAKFEAQKIAFSPLTFQAVRAMRSLGLLAALSASGDEGITAGDAAKKCGISAYGASVLLEIGLGMNIIKMKIQGGRTFRGQSSADGSLNAAPPLTPQSEKFVLGKIGWFLLEDEMTAANFDFAADVCYRGAEALADSIKTGWPAGLRTFGEWTTVYEALSSLPEDARRSWFAFDHYYSDLCFGEALPIVFAPHPKKILDIGGNTARFALRCCNYDSMVQVAIADLPGQTAVAEKNARASGFADRIAAIPCDILAESAALPPGFDAVWMSQFLDCFSLEQVQFIIAKVCAAASAETDIWVLEPFWDRQRFDAAAFSLQATSLYFACIANGKSKMYRYAELAAAIAEGGAEIKEAHHNLGANSYSLLRCRKKTENADG